MRCDVGGGAMGRVVGAPSERRRPRVFDLLDELLADQQQLQTPAARFSVQHDADASTPTMEAVYRDLIPLSAPGPGEQYAFQVDLDACTGCKACVSGCHSLNGLDPDETWRDVGTLLGGDPAHPFQQTVTTACHHCADPSCLAGCPVQAYEKDPITGIVRHLDDQCIGCSYCILTCPYDVPKYSERLGIVRKCDMCQGRLAEGEAPACVQACPTHAITIVNVAVDQARSTTAPSSFLAASPDPAHSRPTTRYVSERGLPAVVVAADADRPEVQHTHWPLVVLLSCTQAALGLTLGWAGAETFGEGGRQWLALVAVLLGVVGIGASVMHLGRPERAWRVFLGLRSSWLSREAVAIGAWVPLLALAAWQPSFVPAAGALPAIAAGVGTVAIGCSAMIYIATPRRFWRAPATAARMGGTVVVAALLASAPIAAVVVLAAKVGFEWRQSQASESWGVLLGSTLRSSFRQRCVLAAGAGAIVLIGAIDASGVTVAAGGALWFVGEIIERSLYFRAVDRSKMPGAAAG